MKKFLLAANGKLAGRYLIILFIIAWQLIPSLGWANPTFVPPFSMVVADGADMGIIKIAAHVCISLKRIFTGFFYAAAAALPLGFVLSGGLPKASRFLRPLISFLEQIPPYILYPVFIFLFGPGENSIQLVIFWSVFFPLLITTIAGVQALDERLLRAARAMACSGPRLFFKVVLPGALPSLMGGIRSGFTMAFLMLIGAEGMGADSGIGWLINNSQKLGWIPRVYFGALLACVVGFLLNLGTGAIERVFVDWKPALRLESAVNARQA
jgi:NitT/TauT family transport system permease protein